MIVSLTLKQLERIKACSEQREEFSSEFPFGKVVVRSRAEAVEIATRVALMFSWGWAAKHLLAKKYQYQFFKEYYSLMGNPPYDCSSEGFILRRKIIQAKIFARLYWNQAAYLRRKRRLRK